MKPTIWNKRIPTLLALVLIVIGIGATSYLVQSGVIFEGSASSSTAPVGVRVTNISSNSFTVSFHTTSETTAAVSYGISEELGETALDDRDSNTPSKYFIHYITLKNLNPSTTYYFSITSSSNTYLDDGELFKVTTGPKLADSSSQLTAKGSFVSPEGTSPSEGIVYINTEGSSTLSVLSTNGNYEISLKDLRTLSLSSYFSSTDSTVFDLLLTNGGQTSTVSINSSDLGDIPLVTLSNSYDFTVSDSPLPSASSSASFSLLSSVITEASSSATTQSPKILVPSTSREEFVDSQPEFRGTAPSGTTVQVTIESDPIRAEVRADASGNWEFRPTTPLAPGQHTITITAPDQFGILQTIKRSFTVHAQGSQVNQTATPSATPTTILSTPTPTPTTILQLTPTTSVLSPTPVISLGPTTVVTPTTVVIPTTVEEPGNASAIIAGLVGFFGISSGIGLLLYSRKK